MRGFRPRFSPYAPEPSCRHATVVERTCDADFAPFLVDAGGEREAVDVHVVVRSRSFECADCGAGIINPRQPVEERPRCTFPICDCLDEGDWARDPHPTFMRVAAPVGLEGAQT